jgi:putative ABC transport system permease protein
VLRGRGFEPSDRADAPAVVLVNQALARRYWPGADPVGSQIRLGSAGSGAPVRTVVGVVGDAVQASLIDTVRPEVIFPYAQDPVGWYKGTTLVVRTIAEPRLLAEGVKAQVWSLGPDLPVTRVRTMQEILAEAVGQDRFNTLLLMAYSVGRRAHEIGVRMALGARAGEVFAMVVGQGLRLSAIGATIGLAGALGLSRVLAGLLHGVSPTDPLTFVAVTLLLAAVAALACFLPARRAARVDPLVALRES